MQKTICKIINQHYKFTGKIIYFTSLILISFTTNNDYLVLISIIKQMKNKHFLLIMLLIVGIVLGFTYASPNTDLGDTTTRQHNNTTTQEKDTPFDKMMQVLTHKRCVNCHPAGDVPLQGEDSHLHNFGVQRGEDDHGIAALRCETCHQEENNDYSGVPGAPEWALAPLKMRWEGLSRVEIAKSMLNPKNNNNRSLEETVKHLTEHKLVLWAWEPGVDSEGNPREKPPVPKDEYIAAVKAWAASGAVIPKE